MSWMLRRFGRYSLRTTGEGVGCLIGNGRALIGLVVVGTVFGLVLLVAQYGCDAGTGSPDAAWVREECASSNASLEACEDLVNNDAAWSSCNKQQVSFVFGRYADDLGRTFAMPETREQVVKEVTQALVSRCL